MARTTATFSVSLPPRMAKQIERARKSEHRTRSEFVREALRRYLRDATLREKLARLPEEKPSADELVALRKGATEIRRGRYKTLARVRHELLGPHRRSGGKKP